jgi:A-factor biosynthesis hotdog domain
LHRAKRRVSTRRSIMTSAVTSIPQLSDKTLCIVSDRFTSFADNKTVMTYNNALSFLADNIHEYDTIVIGQGINCSELEKLQNLVSSPSGRLNIQIIEWITQKVDRHLVHKHQDHNVMITAPVAEANNRFTAHLILDDDCAEMSDHQSGEHIQGAIMSEAARQMFMACALIQDVAPEFSKQSGGIKFALSQMQVKFHNFIFPVDTKVELEFGEINTQEAGGSGCCTVKFYQINQLCCEVFCAANGYPAKVLNFLETRSANKMRKKIAEMPGLLLVGMDASLRQPTSITA